MAHDKALHDAWTDWLSTFHWDFFATLTFAQPRTEASARRAFSNYIRALHKQLSGGSVGYFCGYEHGTFGRLHLHALIRASQDQAELQTDSRTHPPFTLSSNVAWRTWYERYGRAKIEEYDPRRGAAGYVTKYVTKRLAFYDIDNMVEQSRY